MTFCRLFYFVLFYRILHHRTKCEVPNNNKKKNRQIFSLQHLYEYMQARNVRTRTRPPTGRASTSMRKTNFFAATFLLFMDNISKNVKC